MSLTMQEKLSEACKPFTDAKILFTKENVMPMTDKERMITLRDIITKQDEKILLLKAELEHYKAVYERIERTIDKLIKRCKK